MLLSIDPGLGATGWVLWKGARPFDHGLVHTSPKMTLEKRCEQICARLNGVTHEHIRSVDECAIEYPVFYPGSATAATGALVKLSVLVGWIGGHLACHMPCRVYYHPVRAWKGNLPKPIIEKLVRQVLGPKITRDFRKDVWDAAGIGLYHLRGVAWWEPKS